MGGPMGGPMAGHMGFPGTEQLLEPPSEGLETSPSLHDDVDRQAEGLEESIDDHASSD